MTKLTKEQAIEISVGYMERNSDRMSEIYAYRNAKSELLRARADETYNTLVMPGVEFLADVLLEISEHKDIDLTKIKDDRYLENFVLDAVAARFNKGEIKNIIMLSTPFFRKNTHARAMELRDPEIEEAARQQVSKANKIVRAREEAARQATEEKLEQQARIRELEDAVAKLKNAESDREGDDPTTPPPAYSYDR